MTCDVLQERHYGSNNFEVANTLVNLGGVYHTPAPNISTALLYQFDVRYGDLRDYNRQRDCLARALEIEEAHFGQDSKVMCDV